MESSASKLHQCGTSDSNGAVESMQIASALFSMFCGLSSAVAALPELIDSEGDDDCEDDDEEEEEDEEDEEEAGTLKEMPLGNWLRGAERHLRLPQPGTVHPSPCVRSVLRS
jgi:hypothetical protein